MDHFSNGRPAANDNVEAASMVATALANKIEVYDEVAYLVASALEGFDDFYVDNATNKKIIDAWENTKDKLSSIAHVTVLAKADAKARLDYVLQHAPDVVEYKSPGIAGLKFDAA